MGELVVIERTPTSGRHAAVDRASSDTGGSTPSRSTAMTRLGLLDLGFHLLNLRNERQGRVSADAAWFYYGHETYVADLLSAAAESDGRALL